MGKKITYTSGEVFNNITFIEEIPGFRNRRALWKCYCGKEFECRVTRIKSNKTKSCGCLQKEIIRELKTTHGGYNTRLYSIWRNMLRRCNDPKHSSYLRYGGKGIKVCKNWLSFENFYRWALSSGYDDQLTLDRIEGNKGYYPKNCRFTTWAIQANNK